MERLKGQANRYKTQLDESVSVYHWGRVYTCTSCKIKSEYQYILYINFKFLVCSATNLFINFNNFCVWGGGGGYHCCAQSNDTIGVSTISNHMVFPTPQMQLILEL